MDTMQVRFLDASERDAALHLLCEAFREHPMLPPGTPPETTRALFRFMFDAFGSKASTCFHGIDDDRGRLACAALTLSSTDEPGWWDAMRFTFSVFRILGWSLAFAMLRAQASKPKRTSPQLELLLLGTLPTAQQGGLGRAMMSHLYRYAGDKGYAGITLEVAQHSPAYGFYCREGFVEDKTIHVKKMPLCLMHRDLDA